MKTMEGNYDSIQFETRAEIGEVIQALKTARRILVTLVMS